MWARARLRPGTFRTAPWRRVSSLADADWGPRPDIARVVSDVHAAQRNLEQRKMIGDVHNVANLDSAFKRAKSLVDSLRRERNEASKTASNAIKSQGKDSPAAQAALRSAAAVKGGLAQQEAALAAVARERLLAALALPNWSDASVPVGDESCAVQVGTVGTLPPSQDEKEGPTDTHEVIGERCGLFSFSGAASTAGSRFVTLTGQGVLLQQALVAFALDRAVKGGFALSAPPDVARAAAVEACGFAPRDGASQIYSLDGTDLCLIGTGEIPLMAQHAGAVFQEHALPLLEAAVTHCFRREAGGGGQAEGGLYRLHQFTKVELTAVTTAAQSDDVLQRLLSWQRGVLSELGLHARVLHMPSEELGAAAANKFDMEAWMPGRAAAGARGWGEVSSTSHCTDYQARRLNMRVKGAKGGFAFAHTLNGTGLAVPRVMVALLETHQQPDGSVKLPMALQPFMGGSTHITPVQQQ